MVRIILACLLLLAAGCSTTYVRDGNFTGFQHRLGWDTRIGSLTLSRSPTTQSVQLENLQSNAQADLVKAAAEGAAAGVAKGIP